MIYIGLIPDITNIKFLTNMVAHYVLSADVSTRADLVVKHIYLRELRIAILRTSVLWNGKELTTKGFDYCLPSEIAL
jgi:hypothetical protein